MAATYGYGGEFSSDEDIDKIEQISGQVANKFGGGDLAHNRPTKRQIEDTIEQIRLLPIDQEINLPDDILAGLLDHFKTNRGPIVDSTRKLYSKIVMRQIRNELPGDNHDNHSSTESNGNAKNNNNFNSANNNNFINIVSKQPPIVVDSFSSDEEEPIPPASTGTVKKRLDGKTVNEDGQDKVELMDVDSETPKGPVRNPKQVDMSTTDEETDETEESSDESSDSASEPMVVTPIKPPTNLDQSSTSNTHNDVRMASTPKQPEQSSKRQPLAHSTPKASLESTKKPYTRSQRLAATRTSGTKNSPDSQLDGKVTVTTGQSTTISTRASRRYTFLTIGLLVAILAFALYYFKDYLTKPGSSSPSYKINF